MKDPKLSSQIIQNVCVSVGCLLVLSFTHISFTAVIATERSTGPSRTLGRRIRRQLPPGADCSHLLDVRGMEATAQRAGRRGGDDDEESDRGRKRERGTSAAGAV